MCYINSFSETMGEITLLITVLTDGEVGSDMVVQEVGQTLTGVAENLGVNITVISVQRLGEFPRIVHSQDEWTFGSACCNIQHILYCFQMPAQEPSLQFFQFLYRNLISNCNGQRHQLEL